MIDMYGQEVATGDTILTWVKEGKGIELKHVVVTKVNPKTIEFIYDYVPTAKYYSPSTNVAKRKSNQIMLSPHFKDIFMENQQRQIDELNITIKHLISSEEDIARSCSQWKEAFFDLVISVRKAINALEQTPYWDRSGNCEEAIKILKKAQE